MKYLSFHISSFDLRYFLMQMARPQCDTSLFLFSYFVCNQIWLEHHFSYITKLKNKNPWCKPCPTTVLLILDLFSLIYHFMTHHKIQREDTCHAFNWTFPGSPIHPLFALSPTEIVRTRQLLPFTIRFAWVPTHPLFVLSPTQIFVICTENVETWDQGFF